MILLEYHIPGEILNNKGHQSPSERLIFQQKKKNIWSELLFFYFLNTRMIFEFLMIAFVSALSKVVDLLSIP